MVVHRISLYSSHSPGRYSDYPYIHHSLPKSTQTIPVLITVSLVVVRLSLYSLQSLWVVLSLSLSTLHSVWWYSEYPFTNHSLYVGTQNILLLIIVSVVVHRKSLYSTQSPGWYSDYPYNHHSLPKCTQTIPVLITVSLVVPRLSFYTSKFPS